MEVGADRIATTAAALARNAKTQGLGVKVFDQATNY